MEELLKQILEENKKLVASVSRIEKVQKTMAKDIKDIRDYQHKD